MAKNCSEVDFKGDDSKPEQTAIIRVGYEEIEVWPKYCLNRNRNCLQCWLNGKVMCAPRLRRAAR